MLLRTKHSCELVMTKVALLSNVVDRKFNTNPLALITSMICCTHFYNAHFRTLSVHPLMFVATGDCQKGF